MRNKIIGISVCALLVLCAMTGVISTQVKTDVEYNEMNEASLPTTPAVTVRLKFFVHENCTKNTSQMVADCNDIFDGGDGSSRDGEGVTQFGTNGTDITLPDSDFDNISTDDGQVRLLRKLKTQRENCSNGINIIIAPNGHFNYNGATYFNKEKGTADKPYGGIILRDTCNQDQMNKTLAHELLHGLGLSHEQVKWLNTTTNTTESKPIGSTIVNGSGPGSDREIDAEDCGFPVPPHGYAYYDKDGDCDCEEGEEQPENAAGRKIWDIDGNCEFGDANDTGSLLWGRADRTNTTVSPEQKKSIFDTANNTPGYRLQNVSEEVPVPQKEKTKSKGLWDKLKDAAKKFLDIAGGLINIYYDHEYTYFGLELDEMVSPGDYASYYYYIDIDNDLTTGDPLGFDYLIDLLVRPDYIVSALSEWNYGYNMFIEVAELDWNIAQGSKDSEDDEDCNELKIDGMVIQWNVPFDLLDVGGPGSMRFMAMATDDEGRETDVTSEVIMSKSRAIVPVLNLDPFNGNPGDTVTCYGYDYNPNTDVKIEFNCRQVAATTTDGDGDFTTTFTVPSIEQGYYTVNAYDAEGKFHVRLFYVENQAPDKPAIPSGTINGKINVEYAYSSSTTDANGDKLYYLFDWDDGTDSGWVGPYVSSVTASAKHTWTTKGDYEIKVKAKDTNGAESVWSDPLPVTMPRNNAFNIYPLFLRFLEQYPHLFPILRQLLGL